MSLTKQYLDIDDKLRIVDIELAKLKDQKAFLEREKSKLKCAMITEFCEDGVLPDDGLTVRKVPPKPVITDEKLIPENYWKWERKLDKKKLNKVMGSGSIVAGVAMDNGGYTVAKVTPKG